MWGAWPHPAQSELEICLRRVERKEAEVRSELEEQTALALERTGWALQLNQEIEDRTARELQFSEELERLSWARALDRRFHRPLSSGFRMAGYVRDRIRQVLSGKSWL